MSKPNMNPVDSSTIQAIGHDANSNELHVQFNSGATYVYTGVDADTHDALLNAPSVGQHFAKNIKGNFEFKRL